MTVTEQLKAAIKASGETHYRIAKNSGVDSRTLDRFMSGEQDDIKSRTIDLLCDYFGLQLVQTKRAKPTASKKKKQTGAARCRKK